MSVPQPGAFALNHSIFHDLVAWMAAHPSASDRLYANTHTVHAVFRALPPLARQYVMRLVLLPRDAAVPDTAFAAVLRCRQRASDRHNAAMRSLRALHILRDPASVSAIDVDAPPPRAQNKTATPEAVALHARFADAMRAILALRTRDPLGGPLDDRVRAAAPDMDAYSAQCLERLLSFLVDASASSRPRAEGIVPALECAHIVESRRDGMHITSEGFHFLLKPSFPQLWVVLRALLASRYAGRFVDAAHLLFELSATTPGRAYGVSGLRDAQIELLAELHELGVVMLQDGTQAFVPTGVGVRLLNSGCHVGSDVSAADLPNVARGTGEMAVFVETNFRVYAYTSSAFQTNLLGLFTHLRFTLPGMVVAHITRAAVRSALDNGIMADQIIAYLNAHAHPRMKKGTIPPNVSDEIRLWEAEQHRITPVHGALLGDFQTQAAFERVLEFAGGDGGGDGLVWSSTQRRQLFVSNECLHRVKQFIQQHALH